MTPAELLKELRELDVEAAWTDLTAEAEADPTLRPLLEIVAPDDVTPTVMPDGVPTWFPRHHPSTGSALTPVQRRRWFLSLVEDDLTMRLPGPRWNGSPPSAGSRKRQSALLSTLLFMRFAVEQGALPTPE